MATTNFSDKLKTQMTNSVDRLLGQLFVMHTPPMTDAELSAMWNGTFPQMVQDAYNTLEVAGMSTDSLISSRVEAVVLLDLKSPIYLRLRSGRNLRPTREDVLRGPIWENRHWYGPSVVSLRAAAPVSCWQEFVEWLRARAALEGEFNEAFETIKDLIKMASTIGQLRRMMPDLATYLPERLRQILREQQRASSLPHEFAAYDHAKLHRAVAVLAKAQLMAGHADADREQVDWTDYDQYTGARIAID